MQMGLKSFDIFFVGKAAKPQCFKKKTPEEHGFYYHNNTKAWMTSELSEEWPNMTPFIQPCDAGIIRCFKALYCHNFSRQAIDLDKAGECKIYKIDLLEAMVMANEAWNSMMPETIRNCWIPSPFLPSSSQSTTPHAVPLAWKIIYEFFAMSDLSLPNAEIRLQAHLALQAVMDAEGDPQATVLAIKPLEQAAMRRPGLKIHILLLPKDLPQLKSAGDKLAQSINELKA
ncbi:DDE-domain-containing protein [Gyrodon lividus]|nr:DDE-domain-containing protein [Gyrodon lividus]